MPAIVVWRWYCHRNRKVKHIWDLAFALLNVICSIRVFSIQMGSYKKILYRSGWINRNADTLSPQYLPAITTTLVPESLQQTVAVQQPQVTQTAISALPQHSASDMCSRHALVPWCVKHYPLSSVKSAIGVKWSRILTLLFLVGHLLASRPNETLQFWSLHTNVWKMCWSWRTFLASLQNICLLGTRGSCDVVVL